jgi:DNA mismatch endonuclease (patch repair protein)
MCVRRALHAAGLRFRIHRRNLPGNPDIVLPGRRLAVLVHGCFWHQHPGCRLARRPKRNLEYWEPKLARNMARDERVQADLIALGWQVRVIWECEARSPETLAGIVAHIAAIPPVPTPRACGPAGGV